MFTGKRKITTSPVRPFKGESKELFIQSPVDEIKNSTLEKVFSLEGLDEKLSDFTSLSSWAAAAPLSKTFFSITKDDVLWRNRYRQEFGELLSERDYKLQYKAAYFYAKANKCLRSDNAEYLFKKLLQFLFPYRQEPWAQFYLGRMYFQGDGVSVSQKKGLGYFLAAVGFGNARAARYVTQQIYMDVANKRKVLEIFKPEGMEKIFSCLETAYHEKNQTWVARDIGYAYERGIGIPINKEKAKEWYKVSLQQHPELCVAENLTQLYFADAIPELEELTVAISVLEDIYTHSPSADLACQIGKLYLNATEIDEDHKFAMYWFEEAYLRQSSAAAREIAFFHLSGLNDRPPNEALGVEWLKTAFQLGDFSAAKDIFDHMKESKDEKTEARTWLKKGFLQGGVTECATELSRLYQTEYDWQLNPKKVWWIQTAALCGCKSSLEKLKNKAFEGYVYAQCAMAVIFELGVTKSKDIIPSSAQAWAIVSNINDKFLTNYKEQGKKEGLLEDYMNDLFVGWNKQKKKVETFIASTHRPFIK